MKALDTVTLLKEKHLRLTVAESCTGGLLSAAVTDCPGASDVFDCGFITYSNTAKQNMLGVSPDTLNTHGAVSENCAKEMALGALKNVERSDIALSITGIAGPGGGSNLKPVGLVYIGFATEDRCKAHEHHFSGDRKSIREQTVDVAFALLKSYLRGL